MALGVGDEGPPLAYPVLALTFLALLLVPFIGKSAGGAQRWIPLGPLMFQPAEAAKVALVLYLAMTSRKLDDPLAVQVLSSSGSGKSHLQDAVLSLCP
jgi:cell division protein FtsW (lipid II flippase)